MSYFITDQSSSSITSVSSNSSSGTVSAVNITTIQGSDNTYIGKNTKVEPKLNSQSYQDEKFNNIGSSSNVFKEIYFDDPNNIKKLAKLANLFIDINEEVLFSVQLGDIVNYIKSLEKVNTESVEVTAQITGLVNRLRTDEAKDECLTQDAALSGARNKNNSLFKVPKLVDTT